MSPAVRPTAAFFDLDKTIIAKSSAFAFSREFQANGMISRSAVLRSAYAQFVYMVGGADHDQMERLRQFMSQLVTGWDVAMVKEIVADTIHNIVEPMVFDEAVDLIEAHHAAGRDVIIVSTSGAEMVEPIGEMLGADHVVATRLEVADGKYTGKIRFYAYAENKAKAITDLARKRGYDLAECYAYSDSITDLSMLEAVGHPFAVNPDKELRKAAKEREWPILVFDKPVALESRVRLPPAKPTMVALGMGAIAGIGAAIWLHGRRARRAGFLS